MLLHGPLLHTCWLLEACWVGHRVFLIFRVWPQACGTLGWQRSRPGGQHGASGFQASGGPPVEWAFGSVRMFHGAGPRRGPMHRHPFAEEEETKVCNWRSTGPDAMAVCSTCPARFPRVALQQRQCIADEHINQINHMLSVLFANTSRAVSGMFFEGMDAHTTHKQAHSTVY